MSTTPEPLDLTRGVPLDALAEGDPVVGRVDGADVMLVRSQGRVYAVGATCTHYGAPLADGLVANGEVRCPWHHAAFALRTGEVTSPPATSALPCWRVQIADGMAYVRSPIPPRRAPAARAARREPEAIVVVGGGAAGFSAVRTLREEGFRGRVALVSSERTAPVDRPNLSKDYLAGRAPEDWLPLRPDAWYADNDILMLTDSPVTELDLRGRRVVIGDGTALAYDALILATGAEPVRLPAAGSDVRYLRTLDDCRAIARRASSAASAVVIGASFIGLEVAASLRTLGLDVTVVAPEPAPLERILGATLASVIRHIHEEKGVRFRLGRSVADVTGGVVALDDGSVLRAELVVAGVGVRPNGGLAERAGLTVDRGIVVDDRLRTSAPGVFAAGDVARFPSPRGAGSWRIEHWVEAQRQGRTAARNALGAGTRHRTVPFFWSAHYDTTIAYVGHCESPDRVEVDGDPAALDCAVRYFEGGELRAVATIGRDRESLAAEARLERDLGARATMVPA